MGTRMLDDLEITFLAAVDQLTRRDYGATDGSAVQKKLTEFGRRPDDVSLKNLAWRLKDEGYIDAYFASGPFQTTANIELTHLGREAARDVDPVERVEAATRRLIAPDEFRTRYNEAFELWADAERLLWEDIGEREGTTIGHKLREAMQAFATALVAEHRPQNVDPHPAHARARLGAVIAMYRERLGVSRRTVLEAMGDLWEAVDALVQRQEHGATKRGHALGFSDARRVVSLTMFLIIEFIQTLDEVAETHDVGDTLG
jgi:hypothetical protein